MPILFFNKTLKMGLQEYPIIKISTTQTQYLTDKVAVEEPLEIQLCYWKEEKRVKRSLAITMRTPGEDKALALGFLFAEGIIGRSSEVEQLKQSGNTLKVYLSAEVEVSLAGVERSFFTHSSCGICGKPTLDSLEKTPCYFPISGQPVVDATVIHQLPLSLLQQQSIFKETGGIHAAGLFEVDGTLVHFMEDIGRHNALDKLLGYALQQERIPLRQQVLFLSGRISFELVQKASLAGIPIIGGVGAPSSLAIQLALESGITLIGFARGTRFNVYCGAERIRS